MPHPLIRTVGTGLLAGLAGAVFGGIAAALLHLSVKIAATVAGALLAVIGGYFVYKYPPGPADSVQR
jgi:hypothetical protein